MRKIYSDDAIKSLNEAFNKCKTQYAVVLFKVAKFAPSLSEARAKELLTHGFMRRWGLIKHSLINIYKLFPPHRVRLLTSEERKDLEINLQAFVFNIYGAFENFAVAFAKEKKLNLKLRQIGFLKEEIDGELLEHLPASLKNHITSLRFKAWCQYLLNFRHALGHRIPFYVPPHTLTAEETKRYKELDALMEKSLKDKRFNDYDKFNAEQDALGRNAAFMTHSFSENSKQVFFHSQVLADYNTVVEFTDIFIESFRESEVKKVPFPKVPGSN